MKSRIEEWFLSNAFRVSVLIRCMNLLSSKPELGIHLSG